MLSGHGSKCGIDDAAISDYRAVGIQRISCQFQRALANYCAVHEEALLDTGSGESPIQTALGAFRGVPLDNTAPIVLRM